MGHFDQTSDPRHPHSSVAQVKFLRELIRENQWICIKEIKVKGAGIFFNEILRTCVCLCIFQLIRPALSTWKMIFA